MTACKAQVPVGPFGAERMVTRTYAEHDWRVDVSSVTNLETWTCRRCNAAG